MSSLFYHICEDESASLRERESRLGGYYWLDKVFTWRAFYVGLALVFGGRKCYFWMRQRASQGLTIKKIPEFRIYLPLESIIAWDFGDVSIAPDITVRMPGSEVDVALHPMRNISGPTFSKYAPYLLFSIIHHDEEIHYFMNPTDFSTKQMEQLKFRRKFDVCCQTGPFWESLSLARTNSHPMRALFYYNGNYYMLKAPGARSTESFSMFFLRISRKFLRLCLRNVILSLEDLSDALFHDPERWQVILVSFAISVLLERLFVLCSVHNLIAFVCVVTAVILVLSHPFVYPYLFL